MIISAILTPALFGVVGFFLALRFDLRRRKLSVLRAGGWSLLTFLDSVCVALVAGLASLLLVAPWARTPAASPWTPATVGILACVAALLFLWPEGRRQIQLQRPEGIVLAESLILLGFYQLLEKFVMNSSGWLGEGGSSVPFSLRAGLPIVAGVVTLAFIVPRFVRGEETHRILHRVASQGEFVQPEATVPTPECPHPERWQMMDAQSAETEILDLLKALVIAVKPELIVETGTFIGHSAMKMAEGLKANGFGRMITVEFDPAVFAKAKQNIDASGLGNWIEYRNESSLETKINDPIDLLFSDSDVSIRESEIRRFLPQIKPRGLVLVHDASSHFRVVREAALRLEQEGLLSVVLLSSPRGLVIAQKRAERT